MRTRKVLVADDKPFIVSLIASRLETNGFRVFTASNGEEAVRQAMDHKPDLIVMDVMMPTMDGAEAARRIHECPLTQATPVIFLTDLVRDDGGTTGDTKGPYRRGANFYLAKPFEAKKLLSLIDSVLGPAA